MPFEQASRRRAEHLVGATILLLITAACASDGSMTPAVPDQVTVSAPSQSLPVGGQVQLAASVRARGNTLPIGVSGWTSSNPAVATVSGSGAVSGVSRGSATITASVGGTQGSVSLLVAGVRGIQVVPAAVTLAPGGTQALAAVLDLDPGAANVVPTWSSLSPSVATVSNAGVVTAVASGTAVVVASAQGVQGTTTVTVLPNALSECRWPSPLEVVAGQRA
ncbi:MAG: Ig-like domain-containing protein, partial [Chloroflexi bacterium]|nr:Ig-like domain-containing protein [Chloroflexota bacterium]